MSAVGSYFWNDLSPRRGAMDIHRLCALILKLLGDGPATSATLGRLTQASEDQVDRALETLHKDGFIEPSDGLWRLTSSGDRVRLIVA